MALKAMKLAMAAICSEPEVNNHPAHGPLSFNRLNQIREILRQAAAQSDGGHLGYAMADAVKVIDEVLSMGNCYETKTNYSRRMCRIPNN